MEQRSGGSGDVAAKGAPVRPSPAAVAPTPQAGRVGPLGLPSWLPGVGPKPAVDVRASPAELKRALAAAAVADAAKGAKGVREMGGKLAALRQATPWPR